MSKQDESDMGLGLDETEDIFGNLPETPTEEDEAAAQDLLGEEEEDPDFNIVEDEGAGDFTDADGRDSVADEKAVLDLFAKEEPHKLLGIDFIIQSLEGSFPVHQTLDNLELAGTIVKCGEDPARYKLVVPEEGKGPPGSDPSNGGAREVLAYAESVADELELEEDALRDAKEVVKSRKAKVERLEAELRETVHRKTLARTGELPFTDEEIAEKNAGARAAIDEAAAEDGGLDERREELLAEAHAEVDAGLRGDDMVEEDVDELLAEEASVETSTDVPPPLSDTKPPLVEKPPAIVYKDAGVQEYADLHIEAYGAEVVAKALMEIMGGEERPVTTEDLDAVEDMLES